ncbi:GDSL-type esterase/lipase family protein [Maridesulfovibrio bastinii]|uniref:GDSL-type esterase/lipase family protein n=1 Tax=Maridesulfovibrio bastinii TaxID=47157 RepID=UPI000404EA61|nr:GDSL-type esterase/lipase family protein [Maridesulfovibrio bastinii]
MFISCIGDSLTLGFGDCFRLGWVGRLYMNLDASGNEITGYNLGVRASTSLHIQKRWKAEAEARMPFNDNSRLFFCFGTADIAQGVDKEDTLKATRKILEEATALCRTFFICPPPVLDKVKNEKLSEICKGYREICAELNIPCADLFTSLGDSEVYFADLKHGDGVHPDKKGYQAMTDKISELLARNSCL